MGLNRGRPIQYQLRMTEDLHQWLKNHADKNYRTLTAEINMVLESYRKTSEEQEKQRVTAN